MLERLNRFAVAAVLAGGVMSFASCGGGSDESSCDEWDRRLREGAEELAQVREETDSFEELTALVNEAARLLDDAREAGCADDVTVPTTDLEDFDYVCSDIDNQAAGVECGRDGEPISP